MEKLGIFLGIVIVSIVAMLILMNILSDKAIQMEREQTRQIYAHGQSQSMIIQAQAESRLHSAQATAVIMTSFSMSLLPWGALTVASLFGLSIVALFGMMALKRMEQPHIIERQIVYLPAPEIPRREVWRQLSEIKEKVVIER